MPCRQGTVTMLFTDIEGSTTAAEAARRPATATCSTSTARLLRRGLRRSGGREMDTQGDAFFARSPALATRSAPPSRRSARSRPTSWPEGVECRVRMGLHTGEPRSATRAITASALHRGARIAPRRHGGQILISDSTARAGRGRPSRRRNASATSASQQLKDIDRPEHVYQLAVDGLRLGVPAASYRGFRREARRPPDRDRRRRGDRTGDRGRVVIVLVEYGRLVVFEAAGPIVANSVGVFRPADGTAHRPRSGMSPPRPRSRPASTRSGSSNLDEHSVSRIDPVEGVVIQTIPVGSGPAGIAVGGGYVWVTNGLDGTVSKIDPKTDTVVDSKTYESRTTEPDC